MGDCSKKNEHHKIIICLFKEEKWFYQEVVNYQHRPFSEQNISLEMEFGRV